MGSGDAVRAFLVAFFFGSALGFALAPFARALARLVVFLAAVFLVAFVDFLAFALVVFVVFFVDLRALTRARAFVVAFGLDFVVDFLAFALVVFVVLRAVVFFEPRAFVAIFTSRALPP